MKKSLVITSISAPNAVMKEFALECAARDIDFYVIGDVSSPEGFTLDGCDYYDIDRQKSLKYTLAGKLPVRSYTRKNLGYLLSMDAGSDVILETDDDNYPYNSFFNEPVINHELPLVRDGGWVNAYRFFSDDNIWPRGLPLQYVQKDAPSLDELRNEAVDCPIQQGLADDNPDVDAVYRFVNPLPVRFRENTSIALGKGSWCPFNTQNTVFFRKTFPLLYVPSTCRFRQTDIWRSFVAQRVGWENGWSILFTSPTVYQERNEHDLLADFEDEIEGYLNNDRIVKSLEDISLKSGEEFIGDNMLECYKKLIDMKLIKPEELGILDAWLSDIASIY